MNRWLLLRKARGPAFLILFGITALLSEWHVLSFHRSWPLYFILAGVLLLAERAALASVSPSLFTHPPSPVGSMADAGMPVLTPSDPPQGEESVGGKWRA